MSNTSIWLGHRDFRLVQTLNRRFHHFRDSMSCTDVGFREAVGVYLRSSFIRYHRFVTGMQDGTLREQVPRSIMDLPIPINPEDASSIQPWIALSRQQDGQNAIDSLTYDALKLRESERWLVEDFIKIKRPALLSGETVLPPDEADLRAYAEALRDTLDMWLDQGERYRHQVTVVTGPQAGVVKVESEVTGQPHAVVIDRDDNESTCHYMADPVLIEHERLNGDDTRPPRSVFRWQGGCVYLHLPMRRLWWSRSRALYDADLIIAHMIHAGGHGLDRWSTVVRWVV